MQWSLLFSRLLVGPKCTCGRDWRSLQCSPDPLAGGEGLAAPPQELPPPQEPALSLRPQIKESAPKKTWVP